MRLSSLHQIAIGVSLMMPAAAHAGFTARYGSTEIAVEPVKSGGTVSAYYGYDTTNSEASDTADALEADNVGVFFLHEDASGQIALVTLLDRFGSTDVGKVNVVYDGVSGSTWDVIDDPRSIDVRDVAGPTTDGWDVKWTFDAGDADGGALTLSSGSFCVGIDVVRSFGLSSYELVSPDGSGGFTRTSIPSRDWRDIEICSVPDTDGDGVPDVDDDCPGTASGVKVDADGCPVDSDGDGVSDDLDDCLGTASGHVVDAGGCSVADYCPCSDPWSWQGEYVYCVYDEGKVFYSDGLISRTDFRSLLWAAVASGCGRTSCRWR